MITILKSPTADTRTCDFTKVNRDTLESSSVSHMKDVFWGLRHFRLMLENAARVHDWDKIEDIDGFL